MIGVGIMLSQLGADYWLAGSVSATQALATAVIGPQISRLVDRHGQRRVALPATAVTVAAICALLLCARYAAPDWTLYVAAAVAGCIPSMGALVRSRWADLHRESPRLLHVAHSAGVGARRGGLRRRPSLDDHTVGQGLRRGRTDDGCDPACRRRPAVRRPPFGYSPPAAVAEPWLPQPTAWKSLAVQAQRGDEKSMLELYRKALHLRRVHPALGDGTMTWDSTAQEEVLSFTREPGFRCVVNLSERPIALPDHTEVILSSAPIHDGRLQSDTAIWLTN